MQLASVAWDKKMRELWEQVMPGSFAGWWCLEQCAWNSDYFELASWYPEDFSLIGSGTQGKVKL